CGSVFWEEDPRRGFGIAISGGRDRPLGTDGDNSVIVSDVIRGGPADGRLQTRDRIVMVNGVSMENVSSSFAIQTLKSCAKTANVTVKRPRKIQIPVSNSMHPASTYSSHTQKSSDPVFSDTSRREKDDGSDSPLPWRGRYESSNQEPPEDTARGYEGDSSSGRSSQGSFSHSSRHTRHRRGRTVGSEGVDYAKRKVGRETARGYYSKRKETGSEMGGSGSEIGERYQNGLELVSGFKRLPIQDVPAKPIKAVLVKRAENQEYGLKLGSQIFIKHITESGLAAQEKALQEGDLILKINGVTSENMSLADTRRLIEKSRGKLTLTVLRDNRQFLVNIPEVRDSESEGRSSPREDGIKAEQKECTEVEYAVFFAVSILLDAYYALLSTDISEIGSEDFPPPSEAPPPPPAHQQISTSESDGSASYSPDARVIQFMKEKSIGLRLAGGNDVGIFVAAVQAASPAEREGMKEGDQILQVNDTSFHNLTREDAVQYLMGLPQNEDVIFLTQGKEDIYRKMIKSNVGDSFYIRTHFDYESDAPSGLSFTRGEIFHIVDTMYRGKIGSWLAVRVARDLKEKEKGIIPNNNRAEQYASLEPVLKPQSSSGQRAEFWKLRGLRGAKKLLRKSREDLAALSKKIKYPPYERVVLREASFKRPVVVMGPITDIAHQKLCADLPQEFESAESVTRDGGGTSKVIKLDVVREIAAKNKHALLEITPTAVEHLNYMQFYPIVVFCNPENRQGVKAMRKWLLPDSRKSSRRLYAQAVKQRKNNFHLFTATINLSGASDSWLRSLKEIIQTEQTKPIWTTEDKENTITEPLDLLDDSTAEVNDYLSCDSRANSDYEETDAEGGAYTDQELEEEIQEPALARSSEPVLDYQSTYYRAHSPDDYPSEYKDQSLPETNNIHGTKPRPELSSNYRSSLPSNDDSPQQVAGLRYFGTPPVPPYNYPIPSLITLGALCGPYSQIFYAAVCRATFMFNAHRTHISIYAVPISLEMSTKHKGLKDM
uniref:TRAF-interacting protein with FHA domain-containing protein A n=1 Tax=Xenopus tropicalis TaxID=8364 RepID=A0A5S6NZG0_XENTR